MKGAGSSVPSAIPSPENKAKRVTPASFPLLYHWALLFGLSFGDVSFNEACSTRQIQKEHLEVI